MKEIKCYQAFDGSIFDTVEKCKSYENNCKEKIIEDFKGLIVRQGEGSIITKDGCAYPLAEVAECCWYAVIVMHNEEDYQKVLRYVIHTSNRYANIEKIFDKEIFVGIGDEENGNPIYDWFYWYGTVEDAIENYKKAIMTFNL